MKDQMSRFVDTSQHMPDKRDVIDRRRDFNEIYQRFTDDRALEQASRCEQCGIPFCQIHCPVQNTIPDWLKMVAQGRLEEAYALSAVTNNFPEICGRICPQDKLCEGSCVIEQADHGTVTIGEIETYITEEAFKRNWIKPVQPIQERSQSVGIIGAGPAGLTAAEQLRKHGYQVTVYDRYDHPGGLLIYGIPNFKLEKSIVQRRIDLFQKAGIEFRTNVEVGRTVSLAQLAQLHDSLLLAMGTYRARDLYIPGIGLGEIVAALDYLISSNRKGLGYQVPNFERFNARGKDVVVIGGGDTAMDCVRTAVRQGATSVRCLYRRNRANMPGSQREVKNAEEEGVDFSWQEVPEAFLGDRDVGSIRTLRVHLGVADMTGRQTPQIIKESGRTLPCNFVIKALGFDAEEIPQLFDIPSLNVTRWGTIIVDHNTMMTNLEGIFAAGDIVRGASLVVWAIHEGRKAAEGIHRYLQQQRSTKETSLHLYTHHHDQPLLEHSFLPE